GIEPAVTGEIAGTSSRAGMAPLTLGDCRYAFEYTGANRTEGVPGGPDHGVATSWAATVPALSGSATRALPIDSPAMASLLAAARKGVARQSGVVRIALTPFVASKLIGLLMPMLTAWVRGHGAGLPSGSALLQPFALWDGGALTEIAQRGYP